MVRWKLDDGFKWTKGEDAMAKFNIPDCLSGDTKDKLFCKTCGTTMGYDVKHLPDSIFLVSPNLDLT